MTDILILEKARVALQRHHDWHLSQTDQAPVGDDITIIPADEYGDSAMWEETTEVLDLLHNEINRRIGRSEGKAK